MLGPVRFIAAVRLLGAALALAPVPLAQAGAQLQSAPDAKPARVGYLAFPPRAANTGFEAFRRGLRALGYIEGQDLTIEARWANGRAERLGDLAEELVRLKSDVIVTAGDQALRAVKAATAATAIPIVDLACDPLDGFIASLAAPGGRATGLTCISVELAGKRVEMLRDLLLPASGLARIAVLYNPGDANKKLEFRQTQAAADRLGLIVRAFEVGNPDDLAPAFAAMAAEHNQAFVILVDSFMNLQRERLAGLALRHGLPAIYGFRLSPEADGLMSYGTDLLAMFGRAAAYVDKILKGTKPGDLPVEEPTTFELVINLKATHTLGLTVPPSLLARADEVIE